MSQLMILIYPLIAGIISSFLLSYIGVYVVLRRNVFIGLALPQIAGLGIATGFLLQINPLLTSIILVIISVLYFTFSHENKKIPSEAIIGFAYVFSAALSILIIAHSPKGKDEIINLLFGNILIVSMKDIFTLLIVSTVILLFFIIYYKNLFIVSYDSDLAKIQNMKTHLWNFLFYLFLGFSISMTIKIIGSLLVFAFLVIPPMFGLLFTKNLKNLFVFSILFSEIITILGIIASFYLNLPTGAFIIVTFGIMLLVSYGIKKLHTHS